MRSTPRPGSSAPSTCRRTAPAGWCRTTRFARRTAPAIRSDAPITIRSNKLHHNGQEGIRLNGGSGSLVEGNAIYGNGTVGFDAGWEAGGAKFLDTDSLTVRGNTVYGNQGAGLWTDGSNNNTVYDGNKVYDNAGQGIMHEISYAATIANNTVYGNGLGFDTWLWGAQILVSNSPNVEIYGNDVTVPANGGDGIAVVQSSDRGSGRLGAARHQQRQRAPQHGPLSRHQGQQRRRRRHRQDALLRHGQQPLRLQHLRGQRQRGAALGVAWRPHLGKASESRARSPTAR